MLNNFFIIFLINSTYANLWNLRGFAKTLAKIIEKFLIISENLEGFYQMCVTSVIKSPYTNLSNLRGLSKNIFKIIEEFLLISENLEGFYQICVI